MQNQSKRRVYPQQQQQQQPQFYPQQQQQQQHQLQPQMNGGTGWPSGMASTSSNGQPDYNLQPQMMQQFSQDFSQQMRLSNHPTPQPLSSTQIPSFQPQPQQPQFHPQLQQPQFHAQQQPQQFHPQLQQPQFHAQQQQQQPYTTTTLGIPLLGRPPAIAECLPPSTFSLLKQGSSAAVPVNAKAAGSSSVRDCPPVYQRCTLQAIPQTYSLLSKSRIPLGLICNPYKQVEPELECVPVIGPIVKKDTGKPYQDLPNLTLPSTQLTSNTALNASGNDDTGVAASEQPISAPTIIRCRRCRAYINPYIQFVDSNHWRCNFCFLINEVPSFFDYDMSAGGGQSIDRFTRPEINYSVVEYIAPTEYMVRPPQPLAMVFVIDVSYISVSSGMLSTFVKTLSASLDLIPNVDGRTRVGFITVNRLVNFYSLAQPSYANDADATNDPNYSPPLYEPRIHVVADLDDVFLPVPNDLLVNLQEQRDSIELLLEKLPMMHSPLSSSNSNQCALGAAMQAAYKILAPIGGKIVVIQSALPSLGPGALKPREDSKALANGSVQEQTLLQPGSSFYKSFAVDCSRAQVSVDMFISGNQYMDLASLQGSVQYTGGSLYYYPGFDPARPEDAEKFVNEFQHFISRPVGLEAVLRVRATKGLRVDAFHGNFFVRSSDLLALPSVSPDNTYAFQITIEENITSPVACFQSALLYTTCFGERRIRIVTQCLPVVSEIRDLYRSIDQLALTNLLTRMAVERAISSKLEDARDALVNKCVDILGIYRANFLSSAAGAGGQIMTDKSFQLLPILLLSLIKHRAFRGGSQVLSDFRIHAMSLLRVLPLELATIFIYGYMYELHSMDDKVGLPGSAQDEMGNESGVDIGSGSIVMPKKINLTSELLVRNGVYLLDTFDAIYLWLGRETPASWVQELFERPSYETVPCGKMELPIINSSLSERVRNIIGKIRETPLRRFYHPPLFIVKEEMGDPRLKMRFLSLLTEDRQEFGIGYVQFLSELQAKVNKGSF